MKPTGNPLSEAPAIAGGSEVVGLNYNLYKLTIQIRDDDGICISVTFEDVIGFRVLDERDLLEFWPTFSTQAGWAFEINGGGWYDHESRRDGFVVSAMRPDAREFLFTGCDDCVSVIAGDRPRFTTTEAEHVVGGNGG